MCAKAAPSANPRRADIGRALAAQGFWLLLSALSLPLSTATGYCRSSRPFSISSLSCFLFPVRGYSVSLVVARGHLPRQTRGERALNLPSLLLRSGCLCSCCCCCAFPTARSLRRLSGAVAEADSSESGEDLTFKTPSFILLCSCGVAGCNVWLSRFFSCLVHPAASRSHFGLGPVSALPCSCSPSNLPMSDLPFHTDDAIGVSFKGILAATVTPVCGTAEARSHVQLHQHPQVANKHFISADTSLISKHLVSCLCLPRAALVSNRSATIFWSSAALSSSRRTFQGAVLQLPPRGVRAREEPQLMPSWAWRQAVLPWPHSHGWPSAPWPLPRVVHCDGLLSVLPALLHIFSVLLSLSCQRL